MFTGLVETIGTVVSITPSSSTSTDTASDSDSANTILEIGSCPSILEGTQLGDSICINGTCLTVTALLPPNSQFSYGALPTSFTVGVAPETLRRTNLASLVTSSRVNLERACQPNTRLGGHFVQGHVDTTAAILEVRPDGEALVFRFRPRDPAVMRYVVEKGYVTLDGASLTVTAVCDIGQVAETVQEDGPPWWEVMLIPYTQGKIVTAKKKAGEEVNVEIDVVGKYVEKSVVGYLEGKMGAAELGGVPQVLEKMVGRIVDEKLKGTNRR